MSGHHHYPCKRVHLYKLVLLVVCILQAGCASRTAERIVLLPNKDGGLQSAVIVKSSQGEALLNKSFMMVKVDPQGKLESVLCNTLCLQSRYSRALSGQPTRPQDYSIYFVVNGDSYELAETSKITLQRLKTDIQSRAAAEVTLTGQASAALLAQIEASLRSWGAKHVERLVDPLPPSAELNKNNTQNFLDINVR